MSLAIGQQISGALLATAMFRILVSKGLLTPDEAAGIIQNALDEVRGSNAPEELAARTILAGLRATSLSR
jgi:hypothetical protein